MISKAAAHRTLKCMLLSPLPSFSEHSAVYWALSFHFTDREEGKRPELHHSFSGPGDAGPLFQDHHWVSESGIQKEWAMAGYPFLDRCNHLKRSEKEVTKPSCLSSAPFSMHRVKPHHHGRDILCRRDKEALKTLPSSHPVLVQDWPMDRVQVEVFMKTIITVW